MIALTKKLVVLLEDNVDKLTKRAMDEIRKHGGTTSYRTLTDAQLYSRVAQVYGQFDKWMLGEIKKGSIKQTFTAVGKRRREEDFQVSEVIQALIIIRRHIWVFVDSENFFETALDLRSAIDLINMTLVFFDWAIYFTTVGYEQSAKTLDPKLNPA